MKKNFLLQGFTESTYADEVRWVLSTPNIQRAIVSVAFLNEEGVLLLEEDLRQVVEKAIFYCGIRNDITSYQGLLKLFNNGHKVYTVDTGSRGRIFHPKIYYARGTEIARISVGSGNLTLGGLNNNIEAGIGLEVDMRNAEDKSFVQDFEDRFDELHEQYPDNVILIDSLDTLESIKNSGTLLDEQAASPPRPTSSASKQNTGEDIVPRIKLPVGLRYPTIRKTRAINKTKNKKPVQDNPVSPSLLRVWQSKPLTERDLNIPSADGTHSTGSINLDKGLLDEHIDHRHYFRDEVFSELNWQPRNGSEVEEATATFRLVIKDQYIGEFELQIRHTTSTTSASYLQRNAMTRLSWGSMRDYIAKSDYINRTLTLYSDEANSARFVLEID